MALDRSSGERLESRLDVVGLEIARAMQPTQRREDLGVEVGWCVQRVAHEPPSDGTTHLVVQE